MPVPEGAVLSTMGSELLVKLREDWTTGPPAHRVLHKAGSLLAAPVDHVLDKVRGVIA